MSTKVQLKKFLLPVFILLMLVMMTAVNVSPVRADEPEVAKPIPGLGKVTNAQLTGMYIRERNWYDSQVTIFRDANTLISNFQYYITFVKGRDKDTFRLEVALGQFQQALLAAEASRAETNKILTRNAGFNGFFVVLDRDLAGQTVIDVRTSLKGTHMDLKLATKDLEDAFHSWREWILNHN